jgi:hypothetical protein
MKKSALMLLLSLTAYAQVYKMPTEKQELQPKLVTSGPTKSIIIGRWFYGGTDSNGNSIYKAFYIQPRNIATPININNTTFFVKDSQISTGAFQTPLTWVTFSPSCATACIAIELQTQLSPDNSPVTFTLTDGEQFTTYGIVTTVIPTLPGNRELVANQFNWIVLPAVR